MVSTNIAFVFPGQGSQSIGMGKDLAQTYPIASQIFKQADDCLGFSISNVAWEGPEEILNSTINTQPALLTHSVAALTILREQFPELSATLVAGHSMGEISALIAANALSFSDGVKLARKRGELMERSGLQSPGGMAAVLGLDLPTLENVCKQASTSDEIVQVANDNCPGQVVISGADQALERAILLAKQSGAKRSIRLPVSIASHSPLMAHAQSDFNLEVENTNFASPTIPIIGNISALPLITVDAIRSDIRNQLTQRVRWTESIQYMISHGITTFIEIGSGSVLIGLIKRIDRQVTCFSLGNPQDFDRFAESIGMLS